MLIRICLVLAIVAALAAGVLNFLMVQDKIKTIQTQREDEKKAKITAQDDARKTHKELDTTTAKLKATESDLTSTKEDLAKAAADVADKTKRLDKTTAERDTYRKERDEAQQDLAAYTATGVKPEQIIKFNAQIKDLQKNIDASQDENKLLGKKIVQLETELKIYRDPEFIVQLPSNLKGKVVVVDPKWNFVYIDIGQDQGVLEHGELLINRNGKLVAKVKVRSVEKTRCIANVMPGWQLGDIYEGDQAIPAHPSSS